MAKNTYNPKSAKSILKHGEALLGLSLRKLHPNAILLGGKGGLGTSVEKFHYGYEPNSEAGQKYGCKRASSVEYYKLY